jgi:hypothetical protein
MLKRGAELKILDDTLKSMTTKICNYEKDTIPGTMILI